jgi:hypothetical protein
MLIGPISRILFPYSVIREATGLGREAGCRDSERRGIRAIRSIRSIRVTDWLTLFRPASA